MCSIMGYCDCCAAFSDFEEGFKKTVSRGPDDSRIIDTGKGLLGFHSRLNWTAAMSSATARYTATRR